MVGSISENFGRQMEAIWCGEVARNPREMTIDVPNSHWLIDFQKAGFLQKPPEKQEVSMMIDGIKKSHRPKPIFYQLLDIKLD